MASTEGLKKKCVCSSRMIKLEEVVKDLDSRLSTVEECLLGMDSMRGRMFQLEKSMENALDRIMPRLDALLAGLPASATSYIMSKPIFPPSPVPCPNHSLSSPTTGNAVIAPARSKTGGHGSSTQCSVCHSKVACSCYTTAPATDTSVKPGIVASAGTPATSADKSTSRTAVMKSFLTDNKSAAAPSRPAADEDLEKQLREAAARGDVVMCQKIMLQGVDSKKRDPATGDTALHCAARGGHVECITQLLSVAKNPILTTNKMHQTPLMVAAAAGHVEAICYLLRLCKPCLSHKQGGSKALRQAVADGRDDVLKALLDGGITPNQEENVNGASPLHLAASNGHAKCVYELIKKGVQIAQLDNDGQTALHKAALNGHSSCITMLLAAGATPYDKDASGWEPLHLAARGGHIDCVKILLANGVDADPPGTGGQKAAKSNNQQWPDAEEVLMIAGSNIEPVETGNEST